MLDEMPMTELMLWRIKFGTDPIGDRRADFRIANLMALYANAHLPEGKSPYTPADFVLKFEPRDDDDLPDDEDDGGGEEMIAPDEAVIAPETIAFLRARAAQTEAQKKATDGN